MSEHSADFDALVTDLRELVRSWEVLSQGWEYGTAVLGVIQQHERVTPPPGEGQP